MELITLKINLPEVIGRGYKTFWNFKGRYCVVKGSRGSKKSYTAALKLIYNMMKYGGSNTLVIRKVADTNKDSTYAQLKIAINRLNVSHLWEVKKSPMELIYKPLGTKIMFRGTDDTMKITSITVDKGYLTYVWWEEAFQITNEDDFDKVDLSIRGQIPDNLFKQHIICLNPWADVHWINKRFFAKHHKNLEELKERGMTIHYQDEDELVMTTNYKVNEFLAKADLRVFDKMRINFPKRYAVEGVGDWGIAEGLIFENWEEKSFDVNEIMKTKKVRKVFGMDFGFSVDPTTLSCSLVDEGEGIIYIYDEFYKKGMTNRQIAEMLKSKGYDTEKIVADSAEPKSIEELKHLGIRRIIGAKKGADSISAGIQFIQNFKIYIHPRCVNAITEFSLYCWAEDKSGKKLPKPIDDYNHFIDGFRYSLEEFWINRKVQILQRPF